jgi:beta propeller domain-containing protein
MRKWVWLPVALCFVGVNCEIIIRPPAQFTSADTSGGFFPFRDVLAPPGELTDDGAALDAEAREVVEPDVIRRDGNLLYILNQFRGLTIVDLDASAIMAQVPTYGFPRDLYLDGDRAYVLVAYASEYTTDENFISFTVSSRLYVVDVSDPPTAGIIDSFDLDGDLVDSRLVGDVIYAVSSDYDWFLDEPEVAKVAGAASRVTSINVADGGAVFEADTVAFEGFGTVIHASPDAIIVASPTYFDNTTLLTYVDISDPAGAMTVRGSVGVDGHVSDRFKLDIWNGVLRVVTSSWFDGRRVYVTTIDLADPDALAVLAQLEIDRAAGEQLFATRFDGPTAYVVTYFVIDPLFVLDLSDPLNPAVTGELEMPGWLTHIEPRGDRLVAMGVDDTEGRRVSVSLFDVSAGLDPVLLDRVSFGENWSWSTAFSDVKAFTVLDDLLIVPFSGWNAEFGGYDRLQFISWTPDDLLTRGFVDLDGSVLRSFAYGAAHYGVTTEQLATIDTSDLDAPVVVERLTLAENVVDFLELTPAAGLELVMQSDTGQTLVRAVGLPLKGAGELVLDLGQYMDGFVYGDQVALIGNVWEEGSSYRVALLDVTEPLAPALAEIIDVPLSPFFHYYPLPYLPIGRVAELDSDAALFAPIWYPFPSGSSAFLIGDRLVLRGYGDGFDEKFGPDPAYEGLGIIDLSEPGDATLVGLGYDWLRSVDAAPDGLYITTKEAAGELFAPGPVCANYVQRFDPATLDFGPRVNVPGLFVQYDPAGDVLVLRDDQWTFAGGLNSSLQTVAWDGENPVSAIDDIELPRGVGQVLGRGALAYVDVWHEGYTLGSIDIGGDGTLSPGPEVLVTEQWAHLLDAQGDSAYVTVGGGAIARYAFGEDAALTNLAPVMGTPTRLRFGAESTYAPLGYFGLVALP